MAVAMVLRTPPRHGRIAQPAADHDEELTRLTGELAHEIKNPLSTIKVNLKLAEESLQDVDLSDPGRVSWDQARQRLAGASRKIAIIQKETDRLEQILDGFLRYVRRPDLQLEIVDLNDLVGDMIDFYSPQAYSHSLTVRQSLAREPLMCRVDPGAVKQVLLNLFINAQQAMDTGGDLMTEPPDGRVARSSRSTTRDAASHRRGWRRCSVLPVLPRRRHGARTGHCQEDHRSPPRRHLGPQRSGQGHLVYDLSASGGGGPRVRSGVGVDPDVRRRRLRTLRMTRQEKPECTDSPAVLRRDAVWCGLSGRAIAERSRGMAIFDLFRKSTSILRFGPSGSEARRSLLSRSTM
jgi:hypothetical protein